MNTVSATWAKNNFGALIDEVMMSRKKIVVERANRPVVIISPVINDYELDLTETELDKLEEGVKEFRKSFKMSF